MQPDVKNVSSKAPIKIMEKMKDEEVKPKIHTKTSNDTKKAVNQKQPEPNNLNNKKVRELELVELFRASLDPNVYFTNNWPFQLNSPSPVPGNRTGQC